MSKPTPQSTADVPPSDAALGISYNVQIGERRNLVFQTHVPQNVTLRQLHSLVDMLAAVGDRQDAMARREKLLGELDTHESTLARFRENLADVEKKLQTDWVNSGRRGEPKLSNTEKVNRDNLLVSEKRYVEAIAKIKAELAECDALIAIGDGEGAANGTASATDRHAGLPAG